MLCKKNGRHALCYNIMHLRCWMHTRSFQTLLSFPNSFDLKPYFLGFSRIRRISMLLYLCALTRSFRCRLQFYVPGFIVFSPLEGCQGNQRADSELIRTHQEISEWVQYLKIYEPQTLRRVKLAKDGLASLE